MARVGPAQACHTGCTAMRYRRRQLRRALSRTATLPSRLAAAPSGPGNGCRVLCCAFHEYVVISAGLCMTPHLSCMHRQSSPRSEATSPCIPALRHYGSAAAQHSNSGPVPSLPLHGQPSGAATAKQSGQQSRHSPRQDASAGTQAAPAAGAAAEADTDLAGAGTQEQQQQQQQQEQQQAATAFEAAAAAAAAAVEAEERGSQTPGRRSRP